MDEAQVNALIEAAIADFISSQLPISITSMIDTFANDQLPNKVKDMITQNLSNKIEASFDYHNTIEYTTSLSYGGAEISASVKVLVI